MVVAQLCTGDASDSSPDVDGEERERELRLEYSSKQTRLLHQSKQKQNFNNLTTEIQSWNADQSRKVFSWTVCDERRNTDETKVVEAVFF